MVAPIETTTVDLGAAVVTVAIGAGPRILGYRLSGGEEQLFASLPDAEITHPAVGRFRFLGGHRLWRAPENPAVTYQPDDEGASVRLIEHGVALTGPRGGDDIVKEIIVHQRGDATVVDHRLRNEGRSPVDVAVWAITQLAPGGTATLPQPIDTSDPDGVLPNRHLVLWPYTELSAPEVSFGVDAVEVQASTRPVKFKIGMPNRRGWLAYRLADRLFVKWAPLHDDRLTYADMGASVQCYRDERFMELETLGALTAVAPGEATSHREVWTILHLDGLTVADRLRELPAVHPELAS
jgi:hypothetical protein